MPAVAITDTGNLFGALEFSQACIGKGMQPIIGCQIALTRADNPRLPPDPMVLLAQDATGLANLQRLSSHGFLDTDPGLKPQLPLDRIAQHAAGLILLTGGTNGPIARLLAEGQQPEAERLLAALRRSLPRPHHRGTAPPRPAAGSTPSSPGLIALADALGLPLVATNDCFFATPVDVRGARRAAVHRRGRACCRSATAAASPRSIGSSPPPTCARCSPTCRRPATTPSPSRAAAR